MKTKLSIVLLASITALFLSAIITQTTSATIEDNKEENGFTISLVAHGVDSQTGNVDVVVTNNMNNEVVKKLTLDLSAEAQKQYPGDENPPEVKIPISIENGLVNVGEEVKVCVTKLDTGKADCGLTTRESQENIERFGNLLGGPHLISILISNLS